WQANKIGCGTHFLATVMFPCMVKKRREVQGWFFFLLIVILKLNSNGATYGVHSILSFFAKIPIDTVFPSDVFHFKKFPNNCGQLSCPTELSASTSMSVCNGNKLSFNLVFKYIQEFWHNYQGVGRFAGFMLNQAHVGL